MVWREEQHDAPQEMASFGPGADPGGAITAYGGHPIRDGSAGCRETGSTATTPEGVSGLLSIQTVDIPASLTMKSNGGLRSAGDQRPRSRERQRRALALC